MMIIVNKRLYTTNRIEIDEVVMGRLTAACKQVIGSLDTNYG